MFLEIGDSVKTIGKYAFNGQLSLKEVRGGRGLTTLETGAFLENISLRVADFSEAYKLTEISYRCFAMCDSLMSIYLPNGLWTVTKNSVTSKDATRYMPNQFNPEALAYYMVYGNGRNKWIRNSEHIAYTTGLDKDETGRFNNVSYTDNVTTAVNGCNTDQIES